MDGIFPSHPIARVPGTPARCGLRAAVPPPRVTPFAYGSTWLMIVFASAGAILSGAAAAEKFQKLSGAQIRAKLASMAITDEVHWADVYGRDGTLTTFSMGKKSVGKWSVKNDELCHDRAKEFQGCYQVWVSASRRLEPAARRRAAVARQAQLTEPSRSPRMRVQQPCSIQRRSIR